jgi:hypothetical protein
MSLSHRRMMVIIGSIKGLKDVDIGLVGPLYYFKDWAGDVLGMDVWQYLREDPIRVVDSANHVQVPKVFVGHMIVILGA